MSEDSTNQLKSFLSKYSKVLLLFGFLILISIPMIEMMYLLGIKGLFSYFTGTIMGKTGANQYLAKAVLLALMIPLLWSFRWIFSFSSQRRRSGYCILAGYMILFYATMFFLTKDQKFDFSTGKATKYYANTPEGIRYFDSPGFDPNYGIPLKPVDPGVVRSETLHILPPQRINNPKQFFNYATGEPVVWYYESNDGNLEFFDQPGFHPKYKDPLKPVTTEIVQWNEKKALMKVEEEAKRIEDALNRQEEDKNKAEIERKNIEEAERKRVEDQRNYEQKRQEEERKQAEKEAIQSEQARQAVILQKAKEARQSEEARQAAIAQKNQELKSMLEQDLRSFQGKIDNASPGWVPSSSVVNYVKGKRILVLVSNYGQEQGAEIIARLKRMGALVNYSLYSDTAIACPQNEICYSPRYLETTQAIQGSLNELSSFRITSSSKFGDTIIVGVGG